MTSKDEDGRRVQLVPLLLSAVVAGVVLGALGRASDYAPLPVRGFFNLGVPWLAVAFAWGALVRSIHVGALAGTTLLVTAMGAYYGILGAVEGGDAEYAVTMMMSWGTIGLLGGALFGAAGAAFRDRRAPVRVVGVSLLAAALAGEALWLLASDAYVLVRAVVVLELVLGAAIPVIFLRRRRAFLGAVALTACLTAVGAAGASVIRELVRSQGWSGH